MAEELLDKVRDAVEGQIDFHGQQLVDQLTTYLLTAVGIIAFLIGYVTQNITYTLWTGLGGTALAFVALVPPWPWYNKHPAKWLPSQNELAALNLNIAS